MQVYALILVHNICIIIHHNSLNNIVIEKDDEL